MYREPSASFFPKNCKSRHLGSFQPQRTPLAPQAQLGAQLSRGDLRRLAEKRQVMSTELYFDYCRNRLPQKLADVAASRGSSARAEPDRAAL